MRALLLALLLHGPATAADLDVTLEGVDHDVPASLSQELRTVLTRVHAWLRDELGLHFDARPTLRVRLVKERLAYEALAMGAGFAPGTTSGFFHPRIGGIVLGHAERADTRATLVHEASHHFVSEAGARLPRWMDEGLAELMEAFRIRGGAVYLDPHEPVLGWLRAEGHRIPALGDLLARDREGWASCPAPPLADAEHQVGWALVAFLAGSERGRATLAEIARRYPAEREAGVVAAVRTHWTDPAALDRAWRTWFRGRVTPLQLRVAVGDGAVEVDLRADDPCPGGILMRRGGEETCVR